MIQGKCNGCTGIASVMQRYCSALQGYYRQDARVLPEFVRVLRGDARVLQVSCKGVSGMKQGYYWIVQEFYGEDARVLPVSCNGITGICNGVTGMVQR